MTNSMQPSASISVVIPCYCCHDTISRAVESVAQQTLLPRELILINDASPDGGLTMRALLKIVEEFSVFFRIKVIDLTENMGPGSARNRGWDVAQEDYIAFLDADDTWHSHKLEVQYSWLNEHPYVGMCGHYITLAGRKIPALINKSIESRMISFNKLLVSNCFPTPSVMVSRTIPCRYMEGMRQAEDYLLWLTIIREGNSAALLQTPLAYVHKHLYGEAGLSGDLYGAHHGVIRAYRILEGNGQISKSLFFLLFIYSYLKFLRRLIMVPLKRFFSSLKKSHD